MPSAVPVPVPVPAPAKRLSSLRDLWPFLRPYRVQITLAFVLLCLASATLLLVPLAFRNLIDVGFGSAAAKSSGFSAGLSLNSQFGVLFGLASFAEGVDLPGAYCEHVVIAKIPFAVPDDPVEAALAEWIEARGGNPFMEIAVPDASLKLIQACGRLLRTEQDRGVITLLDRRLVTQRYGKAILNALPPFRREIS